MNSRKANRMGANLSNQKDIEFILSMKDLIASREDFAHRVKRWRGGDMRKRWLASAILKAEEKMYKVRGTLGITGLVKNMESILAERQNLIDRKVS